MTFFAKLPTQAEVDAERAGKPLLKFTSERPPRVLAKKLKRAAIEKHRIDIKGQVFKRDGGKCRVCGATATELHELHSRGAGGKRSIYNSIAVCDFRANACHAMLQTKVILYRLLSESFGADSTIEFAMGTRTWLSKPSLTVGQE